MLARLKKIGLVKKVTNTYVYIFVRDFREIRRVINQFNRKSNCRLICDMIKESRDYKIPYQEYFLFDFDHICEEKRRSFVSDRERVEIANRLNVAKNDPIFYDKGITYQVFGKYYCRDVLRIKSKDDKASFLKFASKHARFVCKPIDGGCGVGIKIVDMKSAKPEELFENLLREYGEKCIIEELIVQADAMKVLHPSSVNTVRVPSIRFDDHVEIVHPFLRVGKSGNITDNAGSGGIICVISADKGIVTETADEFGNTYEVHPDTKERLLDFQIPHWEEAVKLVQELAQVVPDNRYCSWDLALTDKGWVMVEVNARGQFIWQYATKTGFRNEVEEILSKLQ